MDRPGRHPLATSIPPFLTCPHCGAQGRPQAQAIAAAATNNGTSAYFYRCPVGHAFSYSAGTGQVSW